MSDAILRRLEAWARDEARISPDAFACRFFEGCNGSVGGRLARGGGCRMSYVGQHYAPEQRPLDFRLVIVGMDHGEKWASSYEGTQKGIEAVYQEAGHQDGKGDFNPHYQGVVRTAVAVLGDSAAYCRANCALRCQGGSPPATASRCVINRIVQPNVVKCVPDPMQGGPDDRTSRTTPAMWRDCAHHLTHELKMLRPNLVVFHGSKAHWPVRNALSAAAMGAEPVEGAPRVGKENVLYYSRMLGTRLLFLHHPSRHRLAMQWDPVVKPCLAFLRERGLIPPWTVAINSV